MPGDRTKVAAETNAAAATGSVSRASGTGVAIGVSEVAEKEGLSVADEIAPQDAGLRQRMARGVMRTFGVANGLTLATVSLLVLLDEYNIMHHLISPADRIITN